MRLSCMSGDRLSRRMNRLSTNRGNPGPPPLRKAKAHGRRGLTNVELSSANPDYKSVWVASNWTWSAPTRPPAAWSIATTAAGPNVPDGIQKTQAPEKLVFADPAVEEHLRRWGASQRRAGLANSRSCQLLDRRPAGRLASCPPSSGWPWPRCWDNLRRPDLPAGPVAPERPAQRAGGRCRCRSRTPSPGIAGDRLVPGGHSGRSLRPGSRPRCSPQ